MGTKFVYPPLAADQVEALQALVKSRGGRWKVALREIWQGRRSLSDAETALYRLRNTHGHGWLINFKTVDTGVGVEIAWFPELDSAAAELA